MAIAISARAACMPSMSRNQPCACGSGKRYKECHGRIELAGPSALYREALAAHQSGSLRRAEALYRQALQADPRDVDSLHMLGVVHFERRHYREALELLWNAAERTAWNDRQLRQNVGLLLAKLLTPEANARQEALVAAYQARRRAIEQAPVLAARVSVVLTVGEDARTVARAIESVAAQTYANIELVVAYDRSTDGALDAVTDCLARLGLPAIALRSTRLGASHAANEGAQRASGRYLAFLGGDDWFAPERVEAMVSAMARAAPLWGFSQVAYSGGENAAGNPPGAGNALRPRHYLAHDSPSFTLLGRNLIERPGNLFVDRNLFLELGGYRDAAQDRGWDFCIRAARLVEPVVVARPLYVHGGRPVAPTPAATGAFLGAAQTRSEEVPADAWTGDLAATNEFCPQFPANRVMLLRSELRAGHGDRLPIPMLRSLAADWRARPIESTTSGVAASAPHRHKVALVVLGMYRSGSSAIARVLNLCGGFLPERVIAARLGINPKGFWEAEAVTDLDARLLELLGGDWNRVAFTLPAEGFLVDEFLLNAREVLETEYGDAALILIKDPRICVLAPLWHRVLQQAGYRPAYVVVVRHPLEVAGSIETQGDMPLAQGLALWLDYMGRVETFVESTDAEVVHMRYTELLYDWRSVVERIARRLDVPLDGGRRADDIDRFLEAGMRNHRADDAELDVAVAGARGEAIRMLYRRLLERCERDRDLAGTA